MYSLDGITWSSRPEELEMIVQRHSNEQAAFTSDLKGEEREKIEKVKPKHKKFARVHNDDELDEIIEEDGMEDLEEDLPIDDVEVDIDEDMPVGKGKKEISKPAGKTKTPVVVASVKKKMEKVQPKPKGKVVKAPPTKSAGKKGSKPAKPAPKAKPTKVAPKGKKPTPNKSKKKAA